MYCVLSISSNLIIHFDCTLKAPILIFPYSWTAGKDDRCKENKQFHKKQKPIPPRIPLQHAIDHLLSASKCSKRYLSAYCLNLHQLTTPEHLLQCIMRKCNPVIKQLYFITHSRNTGKSGVKSGLKSALKSENHHTNHNHIPSESLSALSPGSLAAVTTFNGLQSSLDSVGSFQDPPSFSMTNSMGTSMGNSFSSLSLKPVGLIKAVSADIPPQPNGYPAMTIIDEMKNQCVSPKGTGSPMAVSQSSMDLKSLANGQAFDLQNGSNGTNSNGKISSSHPTADQFERHLPSVPVSGLNEVETRSCPDLDTEYNNISDVDPGQGTPPLESTMSLPLLEASNTNETPKASDTESGKKENMDNGRSQRKILHETETQFHNELEKIDGHPADIHEMVDDQGLSRRQRNRSRASIDIAPHDVHVEVVDDEQSSKTPNGHSEKTKNGVIHETTKKIEQHLQNGRVKGVNTKPDGPTGYSLIALTNGHNVNTHPVRSHKLKHHKHSETKQKVGDMASAETPSKIKPEDSRPVKLKV